MCILFYKTLFDDSPVHAQKPIIHVYIYKQLIIPKLMVVNASIKIEFIFVQCGY